MNSFVFVASLLRFYYKLLQRSIGERNLNTLCITSNTSSLCIQLKFVTFLKIRLEFVEITGKGGKNIRGRL